ncbi:MAG TPA: LPD7 domain-containing protein [Azospirillum sp.]|nr:LPD7 domain-containing protein [Azospirillum sp.]
MDHADRRPPTAFPANSIADGRAPAPGGKAGEAGWRDPLAGVFTVEEAGGERRYYDDPGRRGLALTATDRTIRTEREDRTTVAAMVALAAARGWTEIDIAGSAAFRREAWIEARARGLAARGHEPTQPDIREAERRGIALGRRPPGQDPEPSGRGSREALHAAQRELSADGRLVLAALSDAIDRRMTRIGVAAKAELTAFAAAELVRKERARGPVVLTAEQRRAAQAPARAATPPGRERRTEPDPLQRRR